jgi:uncharacterized damage-inducible protein DinB
VTLNEFIEDAFNKEYQPLLEAVKDLTPEELAWRPGPEANHIGWILWHMVRVEDFWIQFFIQRQLELWEREGWHQKFGLPTRDNGFGHTAEQVANFPALDLNELLKYAEVVRAGTVAYLQGLKLEDFDVVPRERRPDMSVKNILIQLLGEVYQHLGHIAYLKGLIRSGAKKLAG